MEKPYLSIIIPVYNGEKYIIRCLDSISQQTFDDLEILVVNDGSTDGTLDLLNEYSNKEPRLKIINSENFGQSHARNLGINQSLGSVIGFVDSDDWVDKSMYSLLISNLIETKSDVSECSYRLVKSIHDVNKKKENKVEILAEDLPYQLIVSGLKNRISSYSVCNKVYKLNVVNNIRFSNNSYSEDYLFNFKIYAKVDRIVSSSYVGYYYFQRSDSTTGHKLSKNDFKHIDSSNTVCILSNQLHDKKLIRKSKERIIRLYFNFLLRYYLYGADETITKEDISLLKKNYRENVGVLLKSKDMRVNRKVLAILIYIRCIVSKNEIKES